MDGLNGPCNLLSLTDADSTTAVEATKNKTFAMKIISDVQFFNEFQKLMLKLLLYLCEQLREGREFYPRNWSLKIGFFKLV